MSKEYLCKQCIHNNNGWCNKLKKQGLKQIISCEYHDDGLNLPTVVEPSTDMLDVIENCQKPIKVVPISDVLPKEFNGFGRKEIGNFQEHLKLMQARALIEGHYEWRKWAQEIPYIKFPGNWEVKAIPPFAGAIIRYIIKHENCTGDDSVSIYLDCYGELGCVDEPYWELYPDVDGDTYRCGMNNVDDLLSRLHEILDRFD